MIQNPISRRITPDPYVVFDPETGYYYATCSASESVGGSVRTVLKITRARRVQDVFDGEELVLMREGECPFFHIWAPELFRAPDGTWYLYASGFRQEKIAWDRIEIFVMRALGKTPFEGFAFVRSFDEITHAFDPTVYADGAGKLYMAYTQNMFAFGAEKYEQRLHVRELRSPTEAGERYAELSRAALPFELSRPNERINEGPFFVENGGRLFLVYSANGTGNEDYCLGMLKHVGGEICSAASWEKCKAPLLYKSEGLLGPGHASFFRSPDGSELWCAFHAITQMREGLIYQERFACVNRVAFDAEGMPCIGAARASEPTAPAGEV